MLYRVKGLLRRGGRCAQFTTNIPNHIWSSGRNVGLKHQPAIVTSLNVARRHTRNPWDLLWHSLPFACLLHYIDLCFWITIFPRIKWFAIGKYVSDWKWRKLPICLFYEISQESANCQTRLYSCCWRKTRCPACFHISSQDDYKSAIHLRLVQARLLSPLEIPRTVGDNRRRSELTSVKEYERDQRKREMGFVGVSYKQQEKRGFYFITGANGYSCMLSLKGSLSLLSNQTGKTYISQKLLHSTIKYLVIRETSNSFHRCKNKIVALELAFC